MKNKFIPYEQVLGMKNEEYKITDLIEKYLFENHIDLYKKTKRNDIKEWVINQKKNEDNNQ